MRRTGRPLFLEENPRNVRAVLRRHIKEEGYRLKDLAIVWRTLPPAVYVWFNDRDHPITPERLELCIKFLKLDEFDANELRLMAAREAGWNINIKLLK